MGLDRGANVLIVILTFSCLAHILCLLRIYTRAVLIRNMGKDDIVLIISMLGSIAVTIFIGLEVRYGLGKHVWTFNQAQLILELKMFWHSLWTYNLALGCMKLSILFQYLRVFEVKWFKRSIKVMLVFLTLWMLFTIFTSIFMCHPIDFFWDKSIPGGKCLDQFPLWYSHAAVNILTDFFIIIAPMPVLRKLALPKRQRWATMCLFILGGFGAVISVVRLQTLIAIANSKDPTFDNVNAATWSSLEISIGLMCTSLMALKPLVARVFPFLLPDVSRVSRYFNRNGYINNTSSFGTQSNGETMVSSTARSGRRRSSKTSSKIKMMMRGHDMAAIEQDIERASTVRDLPKSHPAWQYSRQMEGGILVTSDLDQTVEELDIPNFGLAPLPEDLWMAPQPPAAPSDGERRLTFLREDTSSNSTIELVTTPRRSIS